MTNVSFYWMTEKLDKCFALIANESYQCPEKEDNGFSETEKCRKNHLFEWYFELSVTSRCSKIARFWLKFAQKIDFWYEYIRKRQRHTFEEDWASSLSILEQSHRNFELF
ncbi:unnamed protein product [Caenorhabditis angaria]|uniref:Uncharacterized protein n=1 Tax=Caenorhabditis angaria TaxID=860376 RepID=A0A9P1IQA2_9PELO|nr:unnamed protein product [Caenorhabditis angaria]